MAWAGMGIVIVRSAGRLLRSAAAPWKTDLNRQPFSRTRYTVADTLALLLLLPLPAQLVFNFVVAFLGTASKSGGPAQAYPGNGINLQLTFVSNTWSERLEDRVPTPEFVDFDRDVGKVHLKSQFIMNGVCVVWRGWLDLQRMDGTAWIEFDEERAQVENRLLRQQLEEYNARLRGIEDQQRAARVERERRAELEAEVAQALLHFSDAPSGS